MLRANLRSQATYLTGIMSDFIIKAIFYEKNVRQMYLMSKTRSWMAIRTRSSAVADERLRPAAIDDVDALAKLMDESYRCTIDHEGETLEQCADEMRGTLSGKYGPYISEASFVAIVDSEAASACLVTRWKEKPLIAFTMTSPKFQRQGLSRALIEQSVSSLATLGEPVLYLVVTDGNVAAKNLYRKLGFKELGRAYSKTPPPNFTDCLETDRLLLEPIGEAHAPELCELFADRELHHYVPFEPPTLEEQQKRCARWAIGHSPDGLEIYLNWAARDKESGKIIGHFQGGIRNQGEASIGYVVAREFQGKGLAQEALRTVFEYLRDVHSVQTVKAWSDTRNKASHRLAQRMGMKIVETIKDADFFKGASSDEFVFAKKF